MKFHHPKMNIENLKAIFEESGNSMTSVSNKNDSERTKNKMVSGKIGDANRKRNQGKISSKVVRKKLWFPYKRYWKKFGRVGIIRENAEHW